MIFKNDAKEEQKMQSPLDLGCSLTVLKGASRNDCTKRTQRRSYSCTVHFT